METNEPKKQREREEAMYRAKGISLYSIVFIEYILTNVLMVIC